MSRTPPEVCFCLKMPLRMSACEEDGVLHVVSTPFFFISLRVQDATVFFVFGAQIIHFCHRFSV